MKLKAEDFRLQNSSGIRHWTLGIRPKPKAQCLTPNTAPRTTHYAQLLIIYLMLFFAICSACFAVDFLPPEQIKPGMKGKGLTVFSGTKIEEFQVEILGVLQKVNAGQDIIVARLSGAGLGAGLEEFGTVAGMSGSPVYIDGKIIGAVAYAWSFQKQPIAGITPIGDMLKLLEEKPGEEKSAAPSGNVPNRIVASVPALGTVELTPILTPVVLGGYTARGERRMKELLEPYGMEPIRLGGGSEAGQNEEADNLQPGSLISVPLILGDLPAAAIGTVTYREGNRILAFGHPFFNTGATALPMGGGVGYGVMPSYSRSFKLASETRVIGSVIADRLPAIMGVYDVQPPLVPATITIKIPESDKPKTFHIQVIQHDLLTVPMLYTAIADAIDNAIGSYGEATVKITVRGSLQDYSRPFEFHDMYYTDFSVQMIDVLDRLNPLVSNEFQKMRIKELEVNAEVIRERQTSTIQKITLSTGRFHPGDEVDVNVYLQRFGGEEYMKTFRIAIPNDARPGPVRILVEGGDGLGTPVKARPVSFDQYFQRIAEWIPSNTISVKLVFPGERASIEGEELPFLPASARGIILYGTTSGGQTIEETVQKLFPTDEIIDGKALVQIMIEKELGQ